MEKKPFPPKELQKSWWWRQKEIRRNGVNGVDWPAAEIAARNYELLRRSPAGKGFDKSYLQLSRDELMVIHALWVTPTKRPYRYAFNRKEYQEKGWTPIFENQHRQWNLRLADKTLIVEFIREIRLLRKIQKIRPQHPLKGQKYRGVSWRYIEILDRMASAYKKPFSASDRHMASVARRDAIKYANQYKRALAEWRNAPNPLAKFEALTQAESM